MTNKLPAFMFYPADWRKDIAVQSLSYHDRGVWHEILCLMHESEQRGKLLLNGQPMPTEVLARILGLDKQSLEQTLEKLLAYGVASLDESNALYNRRMVNDEADRLANNERQRKFYNKNKPNGEPNGEPNANLTEIQQESNSPSSITSSTTNTEEKETTIVVSKKRRAVQLPDNFAVDGEMQKWAAENVPRLDYQHETKQFIDHYTAKGEASKDWVARWRTWQRNAFTDFGKFPNGKPSLKPTNGANNDYKSKTNSYANSTNTGSTAGQPKTSIVARLRGVQTS